MSTYQLMQDHLRAIYKAITGGDLPEVKDAAPRSGGAIPAAAEVVQSFAELAALARNIPSVAERVPPFSFTPPLDAYRTPRELVIEVGVPGVERGDVAARIEGSTLIVEGSRPTEVLADGRSYYHAEMPRGPFRRVVLLPTPVTGEPRVDVERGVVRVQFNTLSKAPPAKA